MSTEKRARMMPTEAPSPESLALLYIPYGDWPKQRQVLTSCLKYVVSNSPIDCSHDGEFDIEHSVQTGSLEWIPPLISKLTQVIDYTIQKQIKESHATQIGIAAIASVIGDLCINFDNDNDTTWFKLAHSLCPVFSTRVYARTAIAFGRAGDKGGYYWANRAIDSALSRGEDVQAHERLLHDLTNRYYRDEPTARVLATQIDTPIENNPFDTTAGMQHGQPEDAKRIHEYIVQQQIIGQAHLLFDTPPAPTTQQVVFTGTTLNAGTSTLINRLIGIQLLPTHDQVANDCITTITNEPSATHFTLHFTLSPDQVDQTMAWGIPPTASTIRDRRDILGALGIDTTINDTTKRADVFPDYGQVIQSFGISLQARQHPNAASVFNHIVELTSTPLALFIKEICVVGPIPNLPPQTTFVRVPLIPMYSTAGKWATDKLNSATKVVVVNGVLGLCRFNNQHGLNAVKRISRTIPRAVPVACCMVGANIHFLASHYDLPPTPRDSQLVTQFGLLIRKWFFAASSHKIDPIVFVLDNAPHADAGRPTLFKEFFHLAAFISPYSTLPTIKEE
jgi:hypothetical protein